MREGEDIIMKISTFRHFTSDATKSLSRNKTLTFASIATVATTLLIMGIFMMVAMNVKMVMGQLGSRLEARVALDDNITIEQKQKLLSTIKNNDGIKELREISKAEGQELYIKSLGDNAEEMRELFEEFLGEDPYPVTLKILVEESKYIDEIVEKIKDYKGIYNITVPKDTIEKITQITGIANVTSIIIFVMLLLVSIFLIMNTIKLTVYSRSREINIMKYVGATDWFIRWPFIIEGIIIGIIGSMIALVVLYGLYAVVVSMMGSLLGFITFASPILIIQKMVFLFMGAGVFIGSIGSVISIRKFLRV